MSSSAKIIQKAYGKDAEYPTKLTGVENPSPAAVIFSHTDVCVSLPPKTIASGVDYTLVSAAAGHPVLAYYVKDSIPYVYAFVNDGSRLVITDQVSKATAALDITGPDSTFSFIYNDSCLRLEDTSAARVLQYNGTSANYFDCTVNNGVLSVEPKNK